VIRRRARPAFGLGALLLHVGLLTATWAQTATSRNVPEWVRTDYGAIVDTRQLSHSGESVGILLRKLDGRPPPPPGQRPADRLAHQLLDPLLEPYAFVLSDTVDAIGPLPEPPMVEVGGLWLAGERQPAWAELLRARRFVVESDGAGRMRAFVPFETDAPERPDGLPAVDSGAAAAAAWERARPVLRHVVAAERRRLAAAAPGATDVPAIELAVYAYRHRPARLQFELGTVPWRGRIDDAVALPDGPPLDMAALQAFLDRGGRLEGGRLTPGGELRLLESRDASVAPRTAEAAPVEAAPASPAPARRRSKKGKRRKPESVVAPSLPTPPVAAPAPQRPGLLGTPLEIADLAVAYRAVFHGGATEPYMSLDRGHSPQTTLVTYGGRLRDTRLGWASLLCDMRFKTFYLGLGLLEGSDLRARLRERLPGFATHLERFARDARSRGILGEQIRFWFYPDDVDLTVSPQGDIVVLRRVRMTATSERVQEGLLPEDEVRADPPWTRATIADINRGYDVLAELFPELGDLDRAVRLLSFFTWLRQARQEGLAVPDLDVLLDVELPSAPTPRVLPQLLSFNALPSAGATGAVEALDRVEVAEALERLNPAGRPLPAAERYARAVAALDPAIPEQRAVLQELQAVDPTRLEPGVLDLLAYRAERLTMHRTVLETLPLPDRRRLRARQGAGESLRVFSVGIGGIDLGMQQALDRARGASRRLGWGAGGGRDAGASAGTAPAASTTPVPAATASPWPAGVRRSTMPAHPGGRPGFDLRETRREDGTRVVEAVYGADGPEAVVRRVELGEDRRVDVIDRYENGRRQRYELVRVSSVGLATRSLEPIDARPDAGTDRAAGGAVRAKVALGPSSSSAAATLPPGLALLRLSADPAVPRDAPVTLVIDKQAGDRRRELTTEHPRAALRRLVLGREAVRGNADLLAGLFPLPDWLGPLRTVMLLSDDRATWPPWVSSPGPLAGELDPRRLAGALQGWWQGLPESAARAAAVVGTHPGRSPQRWAAAPRGGGAAVLLAPPEAFPPPFAGLRRELAASWNGARVVESVEAIGDARAVVLVGTESADRFAARLRSLAEDPRLGGKLLAGWCLGGPVRDDLPAALLADGGIAALGIAEGSVVGLRRAAPRLAEWSRAFAEAPDDRRVEEIGGPFVWFF
jgi:hypothetical protein